MAPVAARYVEAPPVTPLRFGLLDAAVVVDNPDPHLGLGIMYEPENCDVIYRTLGACVEAASGTDKTINDGFPLVEGDAFTVYNLVRCRPVGVTPERLRERATTGLRLGEGRAIEEAFAAFFADATDVTPGGTAVDIVDGLAVLEEIAASLYGGAPTIHVPRGIGTRLSARSAIQRGSRTLETTQGSLVASGGGYTDPDGPSDPGAGNTWIFASGTVLVERNPVKAYPGSGAIPGTSPQVNEIYFLAERAVTVTYECFLIGVKVTESACCGGSP